MQLNPYLFFDGQCEAAFRFYEQVLGGKIVAMMTNEEMPEGAEMPAEDKDAWRKKIMHARLVLGETVLMGSDTPPAYREGVKGFFVTVNIADAATAERVFHALVEGGTVRIPIAETFFAHRFGMLVDRFGIPWMINCEKAAAAAA